MEEKPSSAIVNASAKYNDVYPLRAIVQTIPYVGGFLDTLLAGGGQNWKSKRIESTFRYIEARLSSLESSPAYKNIESDEGLYDLLVGLMEQSVKTRSEEKRKSLANLFANQLIYNAPIDESETALTILSRISELQIFLLKAISNAPVCNRSSFEGLRVSRLGKSERFGYQEMDSEFFDLLPVFPRLDRPAILMSISELTAHGLVKDEGIGRYGTPPLLYFVPTESAFWFLKWIAA